MNCKEIEVITPLGAAVAFGKSGEAVRRAARVGHVRTQCSLMITGAQVRMLDLESAISYWKPKNHPERLLRLEQDLEYMRELAFTFRCPDSAEEFKVLHAFPCVITHDFNVTPDLEG